MPHLPPCYMKEPKILSWKSSMENSPFLTNGSNPFGCIYIERERDKELSQVVVRWSASLPDLYSCKWHDKDSNFYKIYFNLGTVLRMRGSARWVSLKSAMWGLIRFRQSCWEESLISSPPKIKSHKWNIDLLTNISL